MSVVFVSENHLIPPPFKGGVPLQHSSILGVGPYCGLTVHEAQVLCQNLDRWVTQSIGISEYAGIRH